MIVSTHILIGQQIYKNIEEALDIRLDENYFVYGNVKPDIVYSLFTKSHELRDSLPMVLEMIGHLMAAKEISLQQFSTDLGVINHFLSDFFCVAHNQPCHGSMGIFEHLNYEFSLHRIFKTMKNSNLLNLYPIQMDVLMKSSPLATILSLRESYLLQKSGVKNDIFYAMLITTMISAYIINNSLIFNKCNLAA